MRTRVTLELRVILASMIFTAGLSAQNLAGTVVAGDTGQPISGATVIAVQRALSLSQKPTIYESKADGSGRYGMIVQPGQYQLCVHAAGLYLDPCQWGGVNTATVTATTVAQAQLTLRKGAPFILRVHDPNNVLAKAETVPGGAIPAFVSAGPIGPFPLVVVYDDSRVRDYGAVLPLNIALTVNVVGSNVVLNDGNGKVLSLQGIPCQISPSDLQLANPV